MGKKYSLVLEIFSRTDGNTDGRKHRWTDGRMEPKSLSPTKKIILVGDNILTITILLKEFEIATLTSGAAGMSTHRNAYRK